MFFTRNANVLLFAVAFAALAATAFGFCHCNLECPNGDMHYSSLSGDCSNCTNAACYNEWIYLERYCANPCSTYPGCTDTLSCGNVSELAAGIIAAIVVGVLVVVFFFPLLFCFCMGVACFSYRRRGPSYQVVTHSYGTAPAYT